MRLATLERDFWALRSAEDCHRANPERFQIPDQSLRATLRVGQAAKLIFEVEGEDPDTGQIQVGGERMWVIVAENVGGYYIGILDSTPASIEAADDVYLAEGVEILFGPEHVIDIDTPPPEYSALRLSQPRTRFWPR